MASAGVSSAAASQKRYQVRTEGAHLQQQDQEQQQKEAAAMEEGGGAHVLRSLPLERILDPNLCLCFFTPCFSSSQFKKLSYLFSDLKKKLSYFNVKATP